MANKYPRVSTPHTTSQAHTGFHFPAMTHSRTGPAPSVPANRPHYKPRRPDLPMTQRTADALSGATLAGLESVVGLAKERIRRAYDRMGPIELLLKNRKVDRDAYLKPGAESALLILRMVNARDAGPRTLVRTLRIPWKELERGRPGPGVLPPVLRPPRPAEKRGADATYPTVATAWDWARPVVEPESLGCSGAGRAPQPSAGGGPVGGRGRRCTPLLPRKPSVTYFHSKSRAVSQPELPKHRITYFRPKPRNVPQPRPKKHPGTTYFVPKTRQTTAAAPATN
jgi:hypothetical protein